MHLLYCDTEISRLVRTELTGSHQASDPRGMPIDAFVAEVMGLVEAHGHPDGDVLVERSREERVADREDRYQAVFSAMNPT